MPKMPSHVIVEFKHPETNEVIHRLERVPVEVLMQVVSGAKQMQSVMGQTTQVISDVQRAVNGLSRLFGKKRR
jgi:hypothetical protein